VTRDANADANADVNRDANADVNRDANADVHGDGPRRRIVVTGAGRGIGLALVRHLVADGHRVVGTARDPVADALRATGAGVVELDVDRDDTVDALADAVAVHLDGVDILVNNAGIKRAPGRHRQQSAGPLSELRRDAVSAVLTTDVLGPLLVTRALRPLLCTPGAVVVNVSSQLGSLTCGVDVDYAYNAAKAALNMVTVTMSRDPEMAGIVPVALNPGWIRTDMTAGDDAPLELEPATRDIADLVTRLEWRHAGTFVDRLGAPMPW
jgi:NAD(P)-dependent dehydrogenase (short-subunit alcohol dehydrogenase family)